MGLALIERLLKETMGLDAASIGPSLIAQAIETRVAACRLKDYGAYWEHVRTSKVELQELVEAVVVNETWFFRDPEAYVVMARIAHEEWLGTRPSGTLRILSLPCATGEEPYTIAMALLDSGFPADRFQIDAVDISHRAIAAAARAVYGRNSFRAKDVGFRDRYFHATAEGYHVAASVRDKVRFSQGNFFDADFIPGTETFDAIFCRNVLIYFDRGTQDRAVQVLTRLLKRNGTLFVGHSEAALLLAHRFAPIKAPLAFAFRRPENAPAKVPKAIAVPVHVASTARPSPPVRRNLAAAPSPAPPPELGADLQQARRLADQGRLADAAQCCEAHLRLHGPSSEAFCILALIRDAGGNRAEATTFYRKAIYLDPGHIEALVHLALILKEQGDLAGAKNLNDRVGRLTVGAKS